jgi:hypothetical protein
LYHVSDFRVMNQDIISSHMAIVLYSYSTYG